MLTMLTDADVCSKVLVLINTGERAVYNAPSNYDLI